MNWGKGEGFGDKTYELKDHLSNVKVVISDRKLIEDINGNNVMDAEDYFVSDVVSYADYYAFGMVMPGRNGNTSDYSFGFNGMRKDDEVKGNGNHLDYGARPYDTRLGRWLSVDPMAGKQPAWSPYKMAKDNPIIYRDPDGNTEYITITKYYEETGKTIVIHIENKHSLISKGVKTFWLDLQITEFVDYQTTIDITVDKNGVETTKISQKIFTSQNSQDNDFVWYDGDAKGTKKYTLGHTKYSKEDYKVTGGTVLTSKNGEGTPFNTDASSIETIDIDDLMDVLDGVDVLGVLGYVKDKGIELLDAYSADENKNRTVWGTNHSSNDKTGRKLNGITITKDSISSSFIGVEGGKIQKDDYLEGKDEKVVVKK